MHLGVDIGGTFTDLVLMDGSGAVATAKALTTPENLEVGVLAAIAAAAEARGSTTEALLRDVVAFGHGTTQATNALIERDGAVTGLIATRGFGDTLTLQRLMGFTAEVPVDRLGWYSRRRYPEPIIPRTLIREVPERVDQAGRVLVPLDEAATRHAVQELANLGVQTFAVALLWSFRNPSHEQRVGQLIRDICPDAYVSLSCEVAPVIGEYERTATTALNSYLALKVVAYLNRVEAILRERGFRGSFYILNSGGGVIPAQEAARRPVLLVASGPAGGVMGSLHLAKALGERNVITTDMGGTSFDVALIVDGKPLMSSVHEAGGFHVATPMIDIRAVGAGGGSVAVVENGMLRVGPESAGARPGPVCYGNGGSRATVTDADVVLGIISPTTFLGGRMKLDRDAARAAIRDQIAVPLGLTIEQAAAGIRRVVDAHMADTLREVTIGRGHDPRDFVLFAYGGAGPAHCAGFGAELGVSKIIVPATSMAHSAYGALASDIQVTAERSFILQIGSPGEELCKDLEPAVLETMFSELEQGCVEAVMRAGVRRDRIELARQIDMRYRRQTHDLVVPISGGPITEDLLRGAVKRFEELYESAYGRGSGFRAAGIELSTLRAAAVGRTDKPAIRHPDRVASPTQMTRPIFEPGLGQSVSASIWQWPSLPIGYRVVGPAVVEHPETNVYVAPGQVAVLDAIGNLTITLSQEVV